MTSQQADELATLRVRLAEAETELAHWRAAALDGWAAEAAAAGPSSYVDSEAEAMRRTLSWRITRPLREARRYVPARLLSAVARRRAARR